MEKVRCPITCAIRYGVAAGQLSEISLQVLAETENLTQKRGCISLNFERTTGIASGIYLGSRSWPNFSNRVCKDGL